MIRIVRGGLARADRWWARTTGLLLGYGYQPWRALLYLAGVLAVSVTLAVVLGAHGALAKAPDRAATATPAAADPADTSHAPPQPCALIEHMGRGLDLGTPFLPRATSTRCETTISTWILQLVAWALAALFVAGFNGIVRKT
jgi:hypothetical protein